MHHYLLDAGGAGLIVAFFFIIIVAFIAIVLLEALVMQLFKYSPFRKALLDSFLINLVSLAVGYVMINVLDMNELSNDNRLIELLYYFGATLLFEIPLLYFLNNKKPLQRTLLAGLTMNIISYILLFFIGYQ